MHSAHITAMETIDPRIDAIYEADPQLRFVGAGTIADVLKAADATGITIIREPVLVPEATR